MKYKCEKHPKYIGKSKPKYECCRCLSIYLALHNVPRLKINITKFFKDKNKYSRKEKFRGRKGDEIY